MRVRSVAVVAVLSLASCPAAQADSPPFVLQQPFVLGGGEQADLLGGGLTVRFAEVLEDSRCPAQVECFWTGQARITIVAQPGGLAPSRVEFNTNPAPRMTVTSARAGDYEITLQALDPYPQSPQQPIPFGDYRATLVVDPA